MRIPSGVTDQYIYFVAVDATDFTTRETGLSGFTVYRSRNGSVAAAMTTPTVNETDSTNMPGVYELLLDEDMTIGAGNDSEEMVFHITASGMAPVTRTIELYRPKITAGNTLDVTSTGAAGIDWGNVENQSTAVDLSATDIQLCDTVTSNTDLVSAADIADAVWDEATAGHVTAGTFGVATTDILADTNELQTDDVPGLLATAQADLDTLTGADGAILASSQPNSLTFADITISVAGATDSITFAGSGSGDVFSFTRSGSGGLFDTNYSTSLQSEVNAACDLALSDYDAVVPADLPTNFGDMAITASTGLVSVGTNNDKTGYSISGTLNTLDDLDTAQDAQHSTTQSAISTVDTVVDNILVDTGTTLDSILDNLNLGIIYGTAQTGTLSTTQATTNLSGYADDQLIGRILIWTSGNCEGEATDLTDYANASGLMTFTALTTAPANGDTFKII
jgi:hypothetical protein